MRKVTLFLTGAVILVFALSNQSKAAVPQLINYQGVLTDSTGTGIDTTVDITFGIYESDVSPTPIWLEVHTGVIVTGGQFTVLLGSTTLLEVALFEGITPYLGITVGADPEISPRTQLLSVPYSYRVSTVDGASGGNITSKVSIGPGNINTGAQAFVAGENSTASGDFSSVSGGQENTASGLRSTVGGGAQNTASGSYSMVGGGYSNTASGNLSTVSGTQNTASRYASTVAGGTLNIASGQYSTVTGGLFNTASGHYSVAIGNHAKAQHNGSIIIAANATFITSDSIASGGNEQLVIRADGGIYLTNISQAPAPYDPSKIITTRGGAYLSGNGFNWTNASDKNQKENFTDIDSEDLLEKISELPISRWNYKDEDETISHIGPMAQDFYALFGVGSDDISISTIDPAGIALAAIKELIEKNNYLEQDNQDLNERLEKLEKMIDELIK